MLFNSFETKNRSRLGAAITGNKVFGGADMTIQNSNSRRTIARGSAGVLALGVVAAIYGTPANAQRNDDRKQVVDRP